jgi:hypothetical protein
MSASGEYEFVRISSEHFPAFVRLVKDSFGLTAITEDVQRLFDTQAFGAECIGYMAYHRESGEAAAYYGMYPCSVEIDGERILAAQCGSVMTHPGHRLKDLFFETAKRTHELAKTEGITFVFGMPNKFSYRGLMKLGWTHLENAIRYRWFVPTLPLGLLGTKIRWAGKLHRWLFGKVAGAWRVPSFPFPSSVLEPGVGGSHRSQASLAYKPEDADHLMLKVGDSTAWINRIGGQIGIGDLLLGGDDKELRRVLMRLKILGFLSGCNFVRTYVSPDCALERLLKANRFKGSDALAICYLNLAQDVRPERFKWVYGDYDTF